MMPASIAFWISAIAAVGVRLRGLGRVLVELEQRQPDRVPHLGQERDLALPSRIGFPERGEAGELAGDRGVVAEPGHPGLPGCVVIVGGVEVDALVDVLHVGDLVRHVGEVELLDPAEPDEARRHPVGQHDEVPSGVLAGL